jgi:hypothetical protein
MSSTKEYPTDDRILQTETPQIEVDSQLMENFRMAGIARLDSKIYPVKQPGGVPWIFSQSEDRQIALSRPSERRDETFETTYLKTMDEGQDAFFVSRFQGQNILVLPRNRPSGDRVDIYVYGYGDSAQKTLDLKLGSFARPITVLHLFGREIAGTFYLGLIYAHSAEKGDTAAPYSLVIYPMKSLTDFVSPWEIRQPVDSFQHDFGISEDGRVGLYSMITPQVFMVDGTDYKGVYRTDGNKQKIGNMTVFRAAERGNYYRPGDLAERDKLNYPNGNIKMLTTVEWPDGGPEILSPATGYEVAYMDKGTSGDNPYASSGSDGQLFRPVHSDSNYKALGYVAGGYKNSDVEKGKVPDAEKCYMVHKDWLAAGVNFIPKPDASCQGEATSDQKRKEDCNANMIWGAKSKGNQEHVTVHEVTTASGQKPTGNLFTVHDGKEENTNDTYILDTDVRNRESFIYFTDLTENLVPVNGVINYQERLGTAGKVHGRDFAMAHRPEGTPQPFVLDWSGNIFAVRPQPGSKESFRLISSGNSQLRSVLPAFLPDGRLEMYALGDDDQLYYAQMKTQDEHSWTTFEMVSGREKTEVLDFALSTGAEGNTCFANGLGDALYTVHFDNSNDGLRFIPVNIASHDNMQTFTSFNVEMNLKTTYGMSMPEQKIELWSDSRFSAVANGVPFLLSERVKELYSMADGRFTLTIEAFDITAPTVYLRLPALMEAGEYVTIEPNAHIQQMLHGITPEGLVSAQKNALSSEPAPLLSPDDYNHDKLNALSDGINAAFELIPAESEANDSYLSAVAARRVAVKSFKARPLVPHGTIDSRRLEEKYWMIDFGEDKPRFRRLSRAEAEAETEQLIRLASSGSKAASKKGHFWNVSWGSAVHSIKNGLKRMGKFIVKVAQTGISVVLEGLKDAVSYVYTGVMSKVQQVFDAVQCFFTSVNAYFKDLVQWLGYLFNWRDIQRTHEAIVYTVQQVLDFLPKSIERVKLMVDSQFDSIAERIRNATGQLKGKFDTSLGYESQSKAAPESAEGMDNHNVALNGLKANGHKAEMGMADGYPTNSFLDDILDLLNRYDAVNAFRDAADKIKAAMGDRENAFSLLLSALVDILEGLAEMTLAIARGVVDGFFDMLESIVELFNKILNQPIRIPLVSDLFRKISGDDELTILNLLALVVAVPVTPMAKAMFGATPFPVPATGEPDSLDVYKDSLDLSALINAKQKKARVGAAMKSSYEHPAWFYLVVSVGNVAQIPFNAFLDIQPMAPGIDGVGSASGEPTESSPLFPNEGKAIASPVNTFFSLISVATDVLIQIFKIPLHSIKNFFTGDYEEISFSRFLGWLLGWIPIGIEMKSLKDDWTIASLASPVKTLIKCVAALFLIIFRLCQACEGKISWNDALTKVLWRATKFLAILKLEPIATPQTVGIYTGLHAVGNGIHGIGALVDAYEQQQGH